MTQKPKTLQVRLFTLYYTNIKATQMFKFCHINIQGFATHNHKSSYNPWSVTKGETTHPASAGYLLLLVDVNSVKQHQLDHEYFLFIFSQIIHCLWSNYRTQKKHT